jgi:putative ubiquitin-RnfH superfamily antitoxin RatB of RatAB toxin-antitoxin module
MASERTVNVTVCFSVMQRQIVEKHVQLPVGSCMVDAIRASGVLINLPDSEVDALQTGVWGRKCASDQPLREGDRIELYRALKVDPKVARRARFSKQGARTTGLFSKRRAGAKSGY